MSRPSHAQGDVVEAQFGPQAAQYLTSTVHASGADLQALAALVAASPGGRAIDLGCGGGHVSFTVAPHLSEVVAYDLSAEMLGIVAAVAQDRSLAAVSTRQGAAESLPFPDDQFDWAFSRFSAHHWGDMPAGLRETRRVLKPGSRAVFIDTIAPGTPLLDTFMQTVELLRDTSHVRNYTRAQWEAALAAAGLEVVASGSHRLRMEFSSWVARMRTPAPLVTAIRAIQAAVSPEVRKAFAFEEDGSFTIDVSTFEARRPS
jgi:SAM-dependent methyltransferase